MCRLSQEVADVVIPIPLIKKDGTQASGLALGTLSVNIVNPSGSALTTFDPPTYSEPNGDGIYVLKFSRSQLTGAAFLTASKNPYTVTLFSSTANVVPTTVHISIVPNEWSGILSAQVQTRDIALAIKTTSPLGDIIDPSPSDVFFSKLYVRDTGTGKYLSAAAVPRTWETDPVDLFSELTDANLDPALLFRGLLTNMPAGAAVCEVILIGHHYRLPTPTEINDGCYATAIVSVPA